MSEWIITHGPYLAFVILFSLGCYVLASHKNLYKAFVGLYLVQTATILFFILIAARGDGSIPILEGHGGGGGIYMNPLPHALMLTAIVVGVATLGVGLAILRRVQSEHKTIAEG